jgi:hypothetical protein
MLDNKTERPVPPNKPLPTNLLGDRPHEPVGNHEGIFTPVLGSNNFGSTSAFSKDLKTTVVEQVSVEGAKSSGWLKKNLPAGLK